MMLELDDLEWWLKTKKRWSLELSSIVEKEKTQHRKGREDLESAKHLVEEAERALAAAKAREVELSRAIKMPQVEVNVVETSITFGCVLSLEDEQQRMTVPSEDKIKA